jgi:hypothetical protein
MTPGAGCSESNRLFLFPYSYISTLNDCFPLAFSLAL